MHWILSLFMVFASLPQPNGKSRIYILEGIQKEAVYYSSALDKVYDGFPTGNSPMPNFLLIVGDLGYVVNSGYPGSPSLSKIYLRDNAPIAEYPLPSSADPMEAVFLNNLLYVTDFGSTYSEDVLVLEDCNLIDSIRVGKRPSGITAYTGDLYVTATCINEDYSYDSVSFLYKVDPVKEEKESLALRPNALKVAVGSDSFIYALSGGSYTNWSPDGNSGLYKIDPGSFQLVDSVVSFNVNLSYLTLTSGKAALASWYGDVFIVDLNSFTISDFFSTGQGIGGILFKGDTLFINTGSYTGAENLLLTYRDGILDTVAVLSSEDVGAGYMALYEEPESQPRILTSSKEDYFEKDKAPFQVKESGALNRRFDTSVRGAILHFSLNHEDLPVIFNIYDPAGRKRVFFKADIEKGSIPLFGLPRGVYILQASNKRTSYTQKFLRF